MATEDFILDSDYSTINDTGRAIGTVTLPGSTSIASGATFTASTDISLTGSGAMRLLVSSSKDPGVDYTCSRLESTRTWSLGVLSVIVVIYRVDSNTVRIALSAFNNYGSTITSPAGNEVFTVSVANVGMPY